MSRDAAIQRRMAARAYELIRIMPMSAPAPAARQASPRYLGSLTSQTPRVAPLTLSARAGRLEFIAQIQDDKLTSGIPISAARASVGGVWPRAKYGCCSALRWQKPGAFFLVQVLWHLQLTYR